MLRHTVQVALMGAAIFGSTVWVLSMVSREAYSNVARSDEHRLSGLGRPVRSSSAISIHPADGFERDNAIQIKENLQQPNQSALREAYFDDKRESIKLDSFGNYLVDTSTPGFDNEEWLYSTWPLYFPNAQQLNEGVAGCASGGFYVPLQAKAAVVVISANKIQVFHYRCSYQPAIQQYLLVSAQPQPSVLTALDELARRYELSVQEYKREE